jgi:hypothetical protein
MRPTVRSFVLIAAAAGLVVPLGGASLASSASTKSAAPAACTTCWTTTAKSAGPTYATPGQVVTNARGSGRGYDSASKRYYDRVVFDTVSASTSRRVGFSVRYVSGVAADGSGKAMPLSGAYKLEVVVRAPAYNGAGQTTYYAIEGQDLPGVSDGGRIVDTVYAGSFEGWTTAGIGLDARRSFRVVQLADGRIAVDVQR